MVIFLSSAQSVYNQFFCFMYIYQLFLILDHTKYYVEKNTLKSRGYQCGAHRHKVACKDQVGHAKA